MDAQLLEDTPPLDPSVEEESEELSDTAAPAEEQSGSGTLEEQGTESPEVEEEEQ
jgi:hypothetical protein